MTGPVTIVAFGDSLTAGYHLASESAFPTQLERKLHAEGYSGVKVLNFGLSGDTSSGAFSRMPQVLAAKPDIVILELGANDLLRQQPAEGTQRSLGRIIEALKAQNVRIILAGMEMPPFISARAPNLGDYPGMYKSLSEQHHLPFYPHFMEGAINTPGKMLDDQIHPNPAGVEVIVNGIYPLVKDEVRAFLSQQTQ